MRTSETIHLFVYGTLLVTADHGMGRLLHNTGTRVGQGWIRARLYMIDDPEDAGNRYPGAVPSGYDEDRVYGDLYRVENPTTLIETFDVYEACDPSRPRPHEFLRRELPVTLTDGQIVEAVSYMYAWDTSRAEPVPSGRFTEVAQEVR